ncbi:hypothetical protein BFS14_14925 [Serratia fonticola]|nr:hypothetical protein BFS14_14925 [Serratia fonticola]
MAAPAGETLPVSLATVAQTADDAAGSPTLPADHAATMIATLQKQLIEQQELLRTLQEHMASTVPAATPDIAVPTPTTSASAAPAQPFAVPATPADTVNSVVHEAASTSVGTSPVQVDAPTSNAAAEPSDTPQTAAQRQAYASGVSVWREIESSMSAQRSMGIELDPAWVMKGLQDMATHQPLKMNRESVDTIMVTLNEIYMEKAREAREHQQTLGRAFQSAFMKEKGSTRDAGSLYRIVEAGKGKRITASDVVTFTVIGTLPDGTVFDASGESGQTKSAKVGALMPAVAIGLQKLSRGGHLKIVVPPEKGYGDTGLPPTIPGGATLIFDIQVADAG